MIHRLFSFLCVAMLWMALIYLFPPAAAVLAQKDDGRITITAEDITQMRAVRMADVLNQVPGLKAGDSSVAIHGNYKVKVFMDGRPINDPTSALGGVKWDLVSLENVETIEILKGKGGLKYGDDASGGVILISTKKIRRLSGNVKAYGGNHETQSYSGNCRFLKGSLGGAVSGALDSTNGYQVNNDKEKWRAGTKLEYAIDDRFNAALSADYIEEEKGNAGTKDYPTPYSRLESNMQSYSLRVNGKSLSMNSYFNSGWKHNTDESKSLDQELRVKEAGQDIGATFSTGKWGSLNCGAAFEWGQASGTTMDDDQEETGLSFFGSESIQVPKLPLTVTIGLRGNFYSAFDDSINPEIKATWQEKKWNIGFAYNRSNNTPSFHQRYNRTSSKLPNPDLTIEIADNYSLCAFRQLGASLSVNMTLFYNQLTDRITYIRNDEGIGRYENVGEVTYKGGDVSLGWTISSQFKLKTFYTYLEARDETTDLWLTSKPRHKAGAELYCTPIDKLSLVASVDYTSAVYISKDNSKQTPEYTLLDLRGEYRFRQFSFFAEIQNLADANYCYVDNLVGPPRTWIAGVNWTF
ncbi:TonB-dependent receptor [Desulfosarcina variabilis str. Montpellier]|uniref:TonB-dependent receptor n=1 Tax=Desulfosarcina variabilis TaxID=2300 RepID=UPI003AFAAD5D